MSDLLKQVDWAIETRRLFRPGQRILVAVSGGVDSMVLLHLLHELASRHGWRLTAAHFNHLLRGRCSDADEHLVRRTAKSLRIPLAVGHAAVRELARKEKLSLEMAGRELRHGFLAHTATRRHIPTIALAHHADDQLELFFLRLLRGSGGEGLAGMRWLAQSPADAGIQLVRPLLDQPKAVLMGYAAEHGIPYREDASNAALDFQRNRIRHELLPLLRRNFQPALDRTILRVMDIVGGEAELASCAAKEWLARMRNPKSEIRNPKEIRGPKSERGQAVPDAGVAFEQLPLAVQRRCVQVQLVNLGIAPDYELVEQLRTRVNQPVEVGPTQASRRVNANGGHWRPGGCAARGTRGAPDRRYVVRDASGWIRLRAGDSAEFNSASAEIELEGRAGEVEFDGARIEWEIFARGAAVMPDASAQIECFDADKVGSAICLRHWQPGDRFQPIGMGNAVKLQDFFTNQRVPRATRRRLIVATTADLELFWVEGLRISERFKLTKDTKRRLQWRWKRL